MMTNLKSAIQTDSCTVIPISTEIAPQMSESIKVVQQVLKHVESSEFH